MSFALSKDLEVHGELRKALSRPFGKILKTEELTGKIRKSGIIYAIGDVTVATLLELGYMPKVSIFDYKTERRASASPVIRKTYRNPICVRNRRGVLSAPLWRAVRRALAMKSAVGIRVYGEEDLASLACIYFAKKGDIVMYGLRNKGIAVIKVNQNIKDYVVKTLEIMAGSSK